MTEAREPMINRFPGIKKVALEIAYDNGMINRQESEEDWLLLLDEVLGAEGVYEEDLRLIDQWVLTLSQEQIEHLAGSSGEDGDLEKVEALFTAGPKELLGIFEDIFDT